MDEPPHAPVEEQPPRSAPEPPPTVPQTKEHPAESREEPALTDEECAASVNEAVRSLLPNRDVYPGPEIPEKKTGNARRACRIPADEPLLALIDCTVFGSARHCLAFTARGIYASNGAAAVTPGRVAIRYAEFAGRSFGDGGYQEVHLGANQHLAVSGCAVPKAEIIALLRSLQKTFARKGD